MSARELYANHRVNVVAVVPAWLQNPLKVLLQASAGVELTACTTSPAELLALEIAPLPDLILLHADKHDSRAAEQVKQVKSSWPEARCIVFVEYVRQRDVVLAAGADEVLLKGVSARQLLATICSS